MPNQVTATGLVTKTRAELVAQFTAAMQAIYGPDINLASDSPDGQQLNIYVQAALDAQDLVTQVYNGFDPDNAIGVVLDQRVAINGIQRQAGTHTVTDVTVVTSQPVTLYGLDQPAQQTYTVADNAGTQWQLQTSQIGILAGTHVLAFQAKDPGAVLTIPGTITVPITVVLGVVSINNPNVLTTLGINEESDAVLKIRRQQSVSQASQGYLAALRAALLNIPGVTSAFIYENTDAVPDADGIPGHSIWVIVAGTGSAAEIANAIYTKRNAGCGMYGNTTYVITQVDGSPFVLRWDGVSSEAVFIKFTTTSLDGINAPNNALIRSSLPDLLIPGVGEQLNINDLVTLVQQIDNNALVTNEGFSVTVGGSYTSTLRPSAKTKFFSVTAANIVILPIIMSPVTVSVLALGSQQFTPLGGYGPYTYTMLVNASGGSIASSGLYTAGAVGSVTDTVKVQDSLGNIATATVTVL